MPRNDRMEFAKILNYGHEANPISLWAQSQANAISFQCGRERAVSRNGRSVRFPRGCDNAILHHMSFGCLYCI